MSELQPTSRMVPCPHCHGNGFFRITPHSTPIECEHCGGAGVEPVMRRVRPVSTDVEGEG